MKPRAISSLSNLLLLGGLLSSSFTSVDAQDADDEQRRCIPRARIDRTEVIDDQTIAFYLKPDDIYINRLRRACSRLERAGRFSYRMSTSLLCANDLITVLEDSGIGLASGPTCGLGTFRPADEEFVALLKGEERPAEVSVEEIEEEE